MSSELPRVVANPLLPFPRTVPCPLSPVSCPLCPSAQLRLNLLRHRKIIRLRPQIRTYAPVGPVEAIHFMAAVAAVLADQVISVRHVRRGRIDVLLARLQLDHVVMAL